MAQETKPAISADAQAMMAFENGKKSVGISYLLWFFFGGLGVHRFYLGKSGSAIGMLILSILSFLLVFAYGIGLLGFAALGIWLLVDAFLIPGIVQGQNDALLQRIKSGVLI